MSRTIVRAEPRAGTLISMPSAPIASSSTLVGILDVEPIADRLERRHAAQHLERHLHRLLRLGQQHRLVHDLAGRFLGAGERAAEHRAVAAEEQRLGERAVALDAAVGDDRRRRISPTASRHSTSACTCGTPKLVVMRVVQPPPGPMPTLMPSAPRSSRNRAPSAVATLPAIISTSPKRLRNSAIARVHHDRVAVRDVDDDHVDAGAKQLRGALEVVAGGADRGADAQPARGRRASQTAGAAAAGGRAR